MMVYPQQYIVSIHLCGNTSLATLMGNNLKNNGKLLKNLLLKKAQHLLDYIYISIAHCRKYV